MKHSQIAIQLLAAKECGYIKTSAQFWKNYPNVDKFLDLISGKEEIVKMSNKIEQQFFSNNGNEGVLCAYDEDFPVINENAKNSEKPYLLFYKGNVSLLKDLNENVSVIGLLDPTHEIERRESIVVEQLVKKNLTIVSGLANGCDAIAHKKCLQSGGRTIAILPSTLQNIIPASNLSLANEIVERGGLLVTEYYSEPSGRYEAIERFVQRDRLQALFAKAVILIASYRKGEGDSGSRHAMQFAKSFGVERYVMYNDSSDREDVRFGLNKDLVNMENEKIKVLHKGFAEEISGIENPNLKDKKLISGATQLTFF